MGMTTSPRLRNLGLAALFAGLLVPLVVVAGLGDQTADEPPGGGVGLSLLRSAPLELVADRSCDAVADDLAEFAAAALVDQRFASGGADFDDVAADVASGTATAQESAAVPDALPRTGDGDTSETNTQEEGIDEPDVVETDGDFVYLVDQDQLLILDGATGEVVSRTGLGTFGAQLLLQDDRLLVIGGGDGYFGPAVDVIEEAPAQGGGVADDPGEPDIGGPAEDPGPIDEPAPEPLPLPVEPPSFAPGTVLVLLDVSDRAAPQLVQTAEIEGWHVTTRVVDGVARVVVTSYPEVQPMAIAGSADDVAVAREALAAVDAEDWLPAARTTDADGASVEGPVVGCEDVLVPTVNAGVAETSVLRVDFTDGFDPADTTTIVAEAGAVYASSSSLYVAATRYVSFADQGRTEEISTAIHAFDLTGDGPARHVGGGAVPGSVLNQYSLSEYEGFLRVATTEGVPWDESTPSQSGVRVLARDGAGLVEVGAVTGLGLTETIQSVRFMGPVGYVVTFRQTDPLYVIDLADPRAPRAVGELKIPGFSSYLHPVGDGRLVGVGRDASLDGVDQGLLVSLFDVSDPTNPRQVQTYVERDGYSAAGFDPKAFLWWGPTGDVVIPIERYGLFEPGPVPGEPAGSSPAEQAASGMAVLSVSDAGITLRATVDAQGRFPSRALVVQGALWSLFDGAVAISSLDDPAAAVVRSYR